MRGTNVVHFPVVGESFLLETKPMIWYGKRAMEKFLSFTYFLLFIHYLVIAVVGSYCLLQKSVSQYILDTVKEREGAYYLGWFSWIAFSLIFGFWEWIRACCFINMICFVILTISHTVFVLMLLVYVVELFLLSYIGITVTLIFVILYTSQKSYDCDDTFFTCALICIPLSIWAGALSSNYTYWEAGSKQRWWHFLVYCQSSFLLFCHKGTICQIINGKFKMNENDYMFAALTALTYFTVAPIITVFHIATFIVDWFWSECKMENAIKLPSYRLRSA